MPKFVPVGYTWAIVDDIDYEEVSKRRWHLAGPGDRRRYASTSRHKEGKSLLLMHRMILQPGRMCTDHVNGDGLDNRRCNLRICTHKENNANKITPRIEGKSSRFKGVSYRKDKRRWRAYIGWEKERKWLEI
jgi:hypothetical protein